MLRLVAMIRRLAWLLPRTFFARVHYAPSDLLIPFLCLKNRPDDPRHAYIGSRGNQRHLRPGNSHTRYRVFVIFHTPRYWKLSSEYERVIWSPTGTNFKNHWISDAEQLCNCQSGMVRTAVYGCKRFLNVHVRVLMILHWTPGRNLLIGA